MEDKAIERELGSDMTATKIRKPYRTPQLISLSEDLVQSIDGTSCDGGGSCTACS